MSAARQRFLTQLAAYRRAAQDSALLGASPSRTRPDHSARLLRSGLAVVGLAIIEEFLRRRSSEVLASVSSGGLGLSDLPVGLQEATTTRAVRQLEYKVRGLVRDGEDPLPTIQATGRALASTSGRRMVLPGFSLEWDASNVRVDDIKRALAAFQVEQPWPAITAFSRRAGFTLPGDLEPVFKGSISSRHAAAHNAANDILLLDLRTYARHALAVALSYDTLLSRAARLCRDRDAGYAAGAKISQATIGIRFLDDTGAGYAEHTGGPVTTIHPSIITGRRAATTRATPTGEVVIQRDRLLTPEWWATTDL